MNGLKYHRLNQHLSRLQLADKAGFMYHTIYHLEKEIRPTSTARTLSRLANALGVTIEELEKEYPDDALEPGAHRVYQRHKESVNHNCIEEYRKERNLDYRELGEMLGVSREWAHQQCRKRPSPTRKQLRKLAELEGMSEAEFCQRWCPANHTCSCWFQRRDTPTDGSNGSEGR